MFLREAVSLKKKIAVISYNKVQTQLCKKLTEKGCECQEVSFLNTHLLKEYLEGYETVVLPFPSKIENISFLSHGAQLSQLLTENHTVIGGMLDDEIKKDLDEARIPYIDYFQSEAYVLKNAYITSQGAVKLLLENTESFIVGKNVLITGFGRIGKSLAMMLKSLGMNVFVAARSERALAEAEAMGFGAISFSQMKSTLFYYSFIFNTVPFRILSEDDVKKLLRSTVYFELASRPYGAEAEDFEAHLKRYVSGAALPGKLYPEAVAENIAGFILSKWR